MKIFSNRKFLYSLVSFFYCAALSIYFAGNADSEEINVKINFRSQFYQKSNIDKIKLNHPIRISQTDITNHLISLDYKTSFLGSDRERVFSFLAIKKLAPILTKAFTKVLPGRFIRVEVKGNKGLTSFNIFAFKKYLNWRFDSIRGETFLQKNNVRGWNIFSWEMMPKKGQRYFKSGADKRIQKNWIISKLKLPISDRENMDNQRSIDTLQKEPSGNNINPKLEEKLEHLKYLYDKQLINEEEYKNQQKNIFDELF